MNLTSEAEIVNFPATHYVFVEKHGDFPTIAGQAWKSAHTFVPELSMKNKITGYMSLYKVGPKMYRAGLLGTSQGFAAGLEHGCRKEGCRPR